MPELPEVETVRRIAASLVIGRTIMTVRVSEAFPCVLESDAGIDPAPTLLGSTIIDINRRGKYLLFELDSGLWIVIHLRMTGRLLVVERDLPPVRFEHLALELDNGVDIRFGDQRKFGRVRVVLPESVDALDKKLGVEPLTEHFTEEWLAEALARRGGKIKPILLDQHLIAGLGNIYVDEALFRAGIHPLRIARELSRDDVDRLVPAIRKVLQLAIDNQGTTFSTFENPYGESGSNASFLQVYGKGRREEPCPRCGTLLQGGIVGGRGTTWCPSCQPEPDVGPKHVPTRQAR
jgi:formamidopyrimidine-DNA glycosylase